MTFSISTNKNRYLTYVINAQLYEFPYTSEDFIYSGPMKALLLPLLLLISPAFAIADSCAPVAQWSGIISFDAHQRLEDGSIRIKLENTPSEHRDLKNKTVTLQFAKPGTQRRSWFDQQKIDVNFADSAWRAANEDGLILPVALDGLKKVSPLESLAASRPNDLIRVELKDIISVTNSTITIESEPILLEGTEVCLMKFVSVDKERAQVRAWNQETKNFDIATTVALDFRSTLPGSFGEEVTLSGIETQAANERGWNVYTEIKNGIRTVRAIEPYALFETSNAATTAREMTAAQTRRDYWDIDESDKGKTLRKVYRPEGSNVTPVEIGEQFLVAHSFGSYNDHGMTLKYYRGHASIGFAQTIKHPITNETVYQVMYKQTYGHSGKGIFASSMHWHAYNGDLYRGRMFFRPIADVLYPLKELNQNIKGKNFRQELENALDEMSAAYRPGFGKGWARVTMITSCVHDSGNTLIKVVRSYRDHLRKNKVRGDARDLIEKLARKLGKDVDPPASFRDPDLLADNVDFKLSTLAKARKNLTITIPRNFQDAVFRAFVDHAQAPVVVLRTVQTGDVLTHAIPKAPSRIGSYTGAAVGSLMDFVFAKD